MSFLKAEWRNLILANYEYDAKRLEKYLPYKTEIDKWNGICYVSLVGFMFLNTRVMGLKIPGHINFEEVNLRFYVKHKSGNEWKRGVVFIKEIVPKRCITLVANTIYKEHYETCKMNHSWIEKGDRKVIKYEWYKNNCLQELEVYSDKIPQKIEKGSEVDFITEHFWGYTKINDSKTFEYEVKHPSWDYYLIEDYKINVDYELNYGSEFKSLTNMKPKSIMLMEGSEISVENKRSL